MFSRRTILVAIAISILGISAIISLREWKRGGPPKTALSKLSDFEHLLRNSSAHEILDHVALPVTLLNRTPSEQAEFVTKALQGELSAEGVDALKRGAVFGPLRKVFPTEAENWAGSAGVDPDICTAFKMNHNRIQAEVVMFYENGRYRILRCNNVAQMAKP